MEKITLNVQGMSCGHCKAAVETAVKELGEAEANVNLEAGTVEVTYDPATVNVSQVKEAIEDAGYDVAYTSGLGGVYLLVDEFCTWLHEEKQLGMDCHLCGVAFFF